MVGSHYLGRAFYFYLIFRVQRHNFQLTKDFKNRGGQSEIFRSVYWNFGPGGRSTFYVICVMWTVLLHPHALMDTLLSLTLCIDLSHGSVASRYKICGCSWKETHLWLQDWSDLNKRDSWCGLLCDWCSGNIECIDHSDKSRFSSLEVPCWLSYNCIISAPSDWHSDWHPAGTECASTLFFYCSVILLVPVASQSWSDSDFNHVSTAVLLLQYQTSRWHHLWCDAFTHWDSTCKYLKTQTLMSVSPLRSGLRTDSPYSQISVLGCTASP